MSQVHFAEAERNLQQAALALLKTHPVPYDEVQSIARMAQYAKDNAGPILVPDDVRRLMDAAEKDAQDNGLTFSPNNWFQCPQTGRYLNMSGTIILELNADDGLVAFWERQSHDYARLK